MTNTEQRILAALQNGERAPLALWHELGDISFGALYTALGRLEEQGLVVYRTEAGGAERGFRRKRIYRLAR